MAANITAAFAGSQMGPESRRGTRVSEIVSLTGGGASAVGDSLVLTGGIGYKCRFIRGNPQILGGGFTLANVVQDLSGVSFDVFAQVALAGRTAHIEVIGDA